MDNLKEKLADLLPAACEFQAKSMESREQARNVFRKIETNEENILRISIDGLIAHLATNMSNKIETVDEKISYQVSLVTSYIRSHYLISDMILNGDIVEATILIRKQLESLTRMHELDSKPLLQLMKKTPNVINIFNKSGKKLYPQLSEIAHFGTPRVGKLLHIVEDGELIGPSLHPHYVEFAHGCFDMNVFVAIYFLFWLINKQKNWYPNIDTTNDMKTLLFIFQVATESGVIVNGE